MGRFGDILACKCRLAIALSSSFSKKSDRPFGICHKVRSPFLAFSQPKAIDLLELVKKCDRPFGISQKGRSPFLAFSQPSAIALLEFVNKCDRSF
ncbi:MULTISPECIES: hypothetical protein [unclassified Microcoleus]|uniref:hypothetical protein n=1 Tax=unclassified Microcoleus TaxID=2642155 RepID=UPI002FD19C80